MWTLDTYSPIIKTATKALTTEFGMTCKMHTTSFPDFFRAAEYGETPIPLAFVERDMFVLATVTFDPKSLTMSIIRDSSVDALLQTVYDPSWLLPLFKKE